MNSDASQRLLRAALDDSSVSGFTHQFYRYPARFSPSFVRSVIEEFTKPRDLILDPFVGGGTTLVEAKALGREAIGLDISELAVFITRVKTTILSENDIAEIINWTDLLIDKLNIHMPSILPYEWIYTGYLRNLYTKNTWRIRKTIEQTLNSLQYLPLRKQQNFVRCALMRTSQWALDGRKRIPSVEKFREQLYEHLQEMIEDCRSFRRITQLSRKTVSGPRSGKVRCWNRDSVGLENDARILAGKTPSLILTSPPYPGVHVLYHRWQILGRKETSAPFWIANCHDGAGESYYTFGNRHQIGLSTYFMRLRESFDSLAKIANQDTLFVQVVGFSSPIWQLPRYLDVLTKCGLEELIFTGTATEKDGRLWRHVPNRKWHADQKGDIGSSREVVLFHKLCSK